MEKTPRINESKFNNHIQNIYAETKLKNEKQGDKYYKHNSRAASEFLV